MEKYDKAVFVDKDDLFSKAVRAGKRTYFFDVKSTLGAEHYLTITESKKRFDEKGNLMYDKHKIFLYPEDFIKFMDGLNESLLFFNKATIENDSKHLRTISDL